MKNILKGSEYRELKEKIVGIKNFNDLIKKEFIFVHDGLNNTDRVVVYFGETGVAHFGLLEGEKIRSKWGCGLVWEHPLFEVPIEYGNIAKFSDGSLKFNSSESPEISGNLSPKIQQNF